MLKKIFYPLIILIYLNSYAQKTIKNEFEKKIDSLINNSILEKAFPGAQVFIYKNDQIILNKSYGYHTYDSIIEVNNKSLFDLASLTKIFAGTLSFMKLKELYNINLNDKISNYLQLIKKGNKKSTSFKEVLSHSSGWIPYINHHYKIYRKNGNPKFRTISNKKNNFFTSNLSDSLFIHKKYSKKIFKRIKKSKINKLGEYKYSGLWFVLLPKIVKSISGLSFEEFLDFHFYNRMKINRISFLPLKKFQKNEIIPTEKDSLFRKTLVHGWVHDETAALMNGISGNAGLFSNSEGLAQILKMIINEGNYNNIKYLNSSTIKTFTSKAYPKKNNRSGLGFDKPEFNQKDSTYYPTKLASKSSFGHTGFTGTFFWGDIEEKYYLIFLTNRVYPYRSQKKLYELDIRKKLLDYVIKL